MAASKKKVAIIGGGFAGIGCVASLKEDGHEPICFEKTDKYGGTFCYREESAVGVGSIMPTTVLNNSKEVGAISLFPPPKEFSPFLRHNEYYQYMTLCYENRKCESYMRFNTEVVHVRKNDDYDETGRFLVTVKDNVSGNTSTDLFDAVMVATGHFNVPKFITFPGQEKFKGTIIHTHSLKTVEKFKGRNVLIIGMGCSGLDAAVEMSSVAKNVYLSTRSGAHIMSRLGPFGYPFDYIMLRRYTVKLLEILPRHIASWLVEKCFIHPVFDSGFYPVQPEYPMLCKDPVINDGISSKLLSGAVVMKKNVKYFTETGVIFEGEERVTAIDDVILATGYTFDFSFLDKGLLEINNGRIDLYKCVYPPQLSHPTLGFIGFLNPFGPGLPIGEIQIRWFAYILSGKGKLPCREVMMKEIINRYEKNERDLSPSEINCIRVDYFQYIDDIAAGIGVKPNLFKYLFTDFPLFLKLAFGPVVPYQYRLEGEHKWDGARDAIMTSNDRLFYSLRRNKTRRKRNFLQFLYEIIGNLVPRNIFL